MRTLTIATLGCKVNQFESEALGSSFEQKGYRLVPFGESADITVVNTCTVTHRADFQSRQMVRRALQVSPHSFVIVTGCYAQVEPQVFANMKGIASILGNEEKLHLPDRLPLMERGETSRVCVGDIQKVTQVTDVSPHIFRHHTRAFLKLQDGCDARCSYCVVPLARGRSRSLAPESIVEQMGLLGNRGFKEVVLTGIHMGS